MNCNWIIECSDNSSQSRAFSISNFKISIKNNDFSRNTQNHKYWSSIINVKWKGKQADITSICKNRVMSIIIASLFHIFPNQSSLRTRNSEPSQKTPAPQPVLVGWFWSFVNLLKTVLVRAFRQNRRTFLVAVLGIEDFAISALYFSGERCWGFELRVLFA